ncbi:MAG: EutN/CcmL family microcompartment protein [Candidatus Hydrogenedentes bacterium]|nr:EutN/CcmL family microcompartment protein [Candidatus Hydrogenedentota bacterium]
MKLARVMSSVVATQKHPFYRGRKTFMVKPLKLDGSTDGTNFVAVDRVQAGVGDLVLLMQEGSSARFMFGEAEAPVRSVIVGIVDHVDLHVEGK